MERVLMSCCRPGGACYEAGLDDVQHEEELPTPTHSGTVTILGVDLKVHRLDNGKMVIEQDGVHALFEAFANGGDLDADDARKLAKAIGGL